MKTERNIFQAAVLIIILSICMQFLSCNVLKSEDLKKSPSDNFVLIPGGTYMMGGYDRGPAFEDIAGTDLPAHKVTLGSFYLSKYEVTVREFRAFVKDTDNVNRDYDKDRKMSYGAYDRPGGIGAEVPTFKPTDDHPALFITWLDAIEYCNWRSSKEGLKPAYRIFKELHYDGGTPYREVFFDQEADGYRLPTEAEWEYAARSGGKRETYSGVPDPYLPPSNQFDRWTGIWAMPEFKEKAMAHTNLKYNPNSYDPAPRTTLPVGSLKPNGLGLYDMVGNAGEWTWDYTEKYSTAPKVNPTGPSIPDLAGVIRGGSFLELFLMNSGTTTRNNEYIMDDKSNYRGIFLMRAGFRLARGAIRK